MMLDGVEIEVVEPDFHEDCPERDPENILEQQSHTLLRPRLLGNVSLKSKGKIHQCKRLSWEVFQKSPSHELSHICIHVILHKQTIHTSS